MNRPLFGAVSSGAVGLTVATSNASKLDRVPAFWPAEALANAARAAVVRMKHRKLNCGPPKPIIGGDMPSALPVLLFRLMRCGLAVVCAFCVSTAAAQDAQLAAVAKTVLSLRDFAQSRSDFS